MGWPYDSLLEMYIGMFHEQGEKVIPSFCKLTVPRNVWLAKYKEVPQLSEMEAEEKHKLKVYVNDMFKSETPKFRLEACQIIFTLNQCL